MAKVVHSHYAVNLAHCENVTTSVQDHFSYNGWSADKPDYTYDNVHVWDGGFGTHLFQCRKSLQYFIND